MKKVFNATQAGSKGKNEPRQIGSIIRKVLRSNKPLAAARRDRHAKSDENDGTDYVLFSNIYPHTELCVDLKLYTLKPERVKVGDCMTGLIIRDMEDHFTFVQDTTEGKPSEAVHRNPSIYKGVCVNVKKSPSGQLYPTFNRPHFTSDFTFRDFCLDAAEELLLVSRLVEKEGMED